MEVRHEKTFVISPDLPLWRQFEKWQELREYVRLKVIRCVMMFVPEKRGVINDDGAEVRGFLVNEQNDAVGMMPAQAHWFAVGVPMSETEVMEHLRKFGKDGHPVLFVDNGMVWNKPLPTFAGEGVPQ